MTSRHCSQNRQEIAQFRAQIRKCTRPGAWNVGLRSGQAGPKGVSYAFIIDVPTYNRPDPLDSRRRDLSWVTLTLASLGDKLAVEISDSMLKQIDN